MPFSAASSLRYYGDTEKGERSGPECTVEYLDGGLMALISVNVAMSEIDAAKVETARRVIEEKQSDSIVSFSRLNREMDVDDEFPDAAD